MKTDYMNSRIRLMALMAGIICFLIMLACAEDVHAAGTSWATAQQITVGSMKTGQGSNGDWTHYYYFNTKTGDYYYTLESINSTVSDSPVRLYLYDKNKTEIDHNRTWENDISEMTYKLARSSRHYIKVEGTGKGTYKINIKGIKDDIGDNCQDAKTVKTGQKYTYNVNVSDDEDWFKFSTASDSAYYNVKVINTSCDASVRSSLYDNNVVEVEYMNTYMNDYNYMIYKMKRSSIGYIRIHSSEPGEYSIVITKETDPAGEERKNALVVKADTKITGRTSCGEDDDWYSFKAPYTGTYSITFNRGNRVYVYDDDNNDAGYVRRYSGDPYRQTIGRLIGGKTYYINIEAGWDAQNYYFRLTRNIPRPHRVRLHLKSVRKGIAVTFNRPKKAKKYEIAYRKGTGKWKVVTVKKEKKLLRKLKAGRKYTVKVRAFSLDHGKYYPGKWSKAKKIVVNK